MTHAFLMVPAANGPKRKRDSKGKSTPMPAPVGKGIKKKKARTKQKKQVIRTARKRPNLRKAAPHPSPPACRLHPNQPPGRDFPHPRSRANARQKKKVAKAKMRMRPPLPPAGPARAFAPARNCRVSASTWHCRSRQIFENSLHYPIE